MARLRLVLFGHGGGLCLFVRLPGGRRLLIDCTRRRTAPPLAFLRRCGAVDPLHPLDQYLRPTQEPPRLRAWLSILSLLRGLVLRPGGAWLAWQEEPGPEAGFALRARVLPRQGRSGTPPHQDRPPLMVLGLAPAEVAALGGPPSAWVANSSLALLAPLAGGGVLLGGDLGAAAWQRLLARPGVGSALAGVRCYAAGRPGRGLDLCRGLVMAALPWLVLGGLARSSIRPALAGARAELATPAVGALSIEVAADGEMLARAWPLAAGSLSWQGLARPLDDPLLPAPWPLRRALAGA